MSLIIHQFPCLSDNYGFLVHDEASGATACIDTPEVAPILAALDEKGWRLTHIFNTHWHPDHAGGNADLVAATGATVVGPQEVEKIGLPDRVVQGGDVVELGTARFAVIEAGGHTLGHIVYHAAAEGVAFVGDVLFPMGCGRVFEGTAAQMWESLGKIAALPAETRLYSAHEYTLGNARFAVTVDQSAPVAARAQAVAEARDRGEPTVPTTVALERETNPFLRAPMLVVGGADDPVAAFAQIRAGKDSFKG